VKKTAKSSLLLESSSRFNTLSYIPNIALGNVELTPVGIDRNCTYKIKIHFQLAMPFRVAFNCL